KMMLHDLLHYHRETGGNTLLPRNFESNEVLAPLQSPSPPSDFQDRYEEFGESFQCCKLPGGTERERGGIVLPVLPKGHGPSYMVVRGNYHLGSDVFPWPRLPTKQYYDVTMLKKSDVNSFFLFILLPTEINSRPLSLPFPTSHPYHTHISKYAMFPDFRPIEDQDTGIPCKASDVVVLKSTKGKMVLCWLITYSGILFRTLLKSHDSFLMKLKNPSKTVAPNSILREFKLSQRKTNLLRNIERSQRMTTYKLNFTGRGPMNPLNLDDYYMKAVGQLTGVLGTDVELKESFMSSLSQTRPLEGRIARKMQGRRPRESTLQEQQAKPPQLSHQKYHLDTGLPISKHQRITDRLQTEAFYQGQFSGRPEIQPFPREDLKQCTIWENPPSKAVLPQDENREEGKIVLQKLWNQEASQPAWRPEDRLRDEAMPECIPGSGVARRPTVLMELQDSFSKTAAHKWFHDSINGERKDLRDNISEGRRHEFYGFNAFYFHN
uniref:Sperm microtubule inner protein 4 n=1 Tax=Coturnix japonica TaxID=93934 RepID=A0A8C2YBS8_COTJA